LGFPGFCFPEDPPCAESLLEIDFSPAAAQQHGLSFSKPPSWKNLPIKGILPSVTSTTLPLTLEVTVSVNPEITASAVLTVLAPTGESLAQYWP